jgi:hypothetical protein
LVKEGRSLVSEGELFLINSISHKKSRGYYYLFSDLFLYTTTKILRPSNQRKFTIKYELPLDSVVIVEKEDFSMYISEEKNGNAKCAQSTYFFLLSLMSSCFFSFRYSQRF